MQPVLSSMSDSTSPREFYTCDGPQLKSLLEAGATWLTTNQAIVNALNVFPIPDGDTGTNMLMTLQAAQREAAPLTDRPVSKVAHAIAHGALMGARGNSGVILSQIWRGFARALDSVETFDAPLLARALREASDTAYRGAVRPVEGTILTVIKDCALAAEDAMARHRDLGAVLERVVAAAHQSVARTPDLLPVLKQAGVVDSGGKGLTIILEGMLRFLRGLPLDKPLDTIVRPVNLDAVGAAMEELEPGQEWEVIVDFRPDGLLHLPSLYQRLEQMGVAIQVGEGDGLYRVHIHLLKTRRYEPIELVEEMGTVLNVHMENLLTQVESRIAEQPLPLRQVQPGEVAVVAVTPGRGLAQVLASLGVAAIVGGGQSKNPSTEEILNAIGDLPTDKVIVLPNNKNIVMAAQQARDMSVKQVQVVPSHTVPQGLAAMRVYVPEAELTDLAAKMERAMKQVDSGEVTLATRTVELNGVAVNEGQAIGLANGKLAVTGGDALAALLALLDHMGAADKEVLDLFYGAEVEAAQANTVAEVVRGKFPHLDISVQAGGQPHYYYILSLE